MSADGSSARVVERDGPWWNPRCRTGFLFRLLVVPVVALVAINPATLPATLVTMLLAQLAAEGLASLWPVFQRRDTGGRYRAMWRAFDRRETGDKT